MKGPGGDCSRPGLWPTTDWVADVKHDRPLLFAMVAINERRAGAR